MTPDGDPSAAVVLPGTEALSARFLFDAFGIAHLYDHLRAFPLTEGIDRIIFDPDWYYGRYIGWRNVSSLGLLPAMDYVESCANGFVNPNHWFDELFYRRTYHDVRNGIFAGQFRCGYHHYLQFGIFEGRNPSSEFDEGAYRRENRDVHEAITAGRVPNGLLHYEAYGFAEGRALAAGNVGGEEGTPLREFHMGPGVKPSGQPFGFFATTRDPQFWVNVTVPKGFYRLQIRLVYQKLAVSLAHAQIFFNDQAGISEANSLRFRIEDGRLTVDCLLHAPQQMTGLRFDPSDTRGEFFIEHFSVAPVSERMGRHRVVQAMLRLQGHKRQRVLARMGDKGADGVWQHLCRMLSPALPAGAGDYSAWVEARSIDAHARAYLADKVPTLAARPTFSVLMPTYKADVALLARAIQSVQEQIYPDWELIVVEDGSKDKAAIAYLRGLPKSDRVKIRFEKENRGIAGATNIALGLATGEFIALLDHDDELAPHALFAFAQRIAARPEADMLYSDEDKIGEDGKRFGALFKPAWSPEFMWSCMYTCHLGVYRTALVREVGGFRPAFDFAQDYDLALRVSARARAIEHIPDVLYHWRITAQSTAGGADAKPTAELAARRAVQAAVKAAGLKNRVVAGPLRGTHRLKPAAGATPLVSIVIPTAGRRIAKETPRWYLLDLVESIRALSTYPNYELVLVHNGDLEPALARKLAKHKPRLVHYTNPVFNIADKMNLGVAAARGEYTLLLNDDMRVDEPAWIEELLTVVQIPGVIAAGAKLLFPNGTVQHAGVLLLAQGPSHPYYECEADEPGIAGSAVLLRNYSAVTGACLLLRTTDYTRVGGFDPSFRVNYNDVDFCLKLLQHGRIAYTPYARLTHYESVSKDEAPADELDRLNEAWGHIVGHDPAYNRNLSQFSSTGEIAYPARTIFQDY